MMFQEMRKFVSFSLNLTFTFLSFSLSIAHLDISGVFYVENVEIRYAVVLLIIPNGRVV